jgi:hypothetical protein
MSRRNRRTTRIVLAALAAGAVLAANGTMVYLGGSYASYSDTRTIPLINITVTAHLRTTTPPSTPPPTTTRSAPVHRASTQPQTPAPQQNQPPTDTPTTAPTASGPATPIQSPASTTTESDSE